MSNFLKQLKIEILDYPIPIIFLFIGLGFLWFSERWEFHYKIAGISIMSMALGMLIGRHDGGSNIGNGRRRKIKKLIEESLEEERRLQ